MSNDTETVHQEEACSFDAQRYVAEVTAACVMRGLRLTTLRKEVLQLIASSGRPVKAYDLLDALRSNRSGAAPPTVYRALDFLMEHGFVHKIESMNAFMGCHHLTTAQHSGPFLICDVCQTAFELDDKGINQVISAQADTLGFAPRSQTVEVHGVCSQCRDED